MRWVVADISCIENIGNKYLYVNNALELSVQRALCELKNKLIIIFKISRS
jgi:hypothetical protein